MSLAGDGPSSLIRGTAEPVQAGVAVLVNENLDAASLQFYRQSRIGCGSGPVPAATSRTAAICLAL